MTPSQKQHERSKKEAEIFARANDQALFGNRALFQTKELGACVLSWKGCRWECEWIDADFSFFI